MSDFIDIGSTADVPKGSGRAFTVAGRRIAVYHTESGFRATENTCPHRGGPLAEGDVIADTITCPWHVWTFSLQTGQLENDPSIAIPVHDVRIEGDRLLVRLNSAEKEIP